MVRIPPSPQKKTSAPQGHFLFPDAWRACLPKRKGIKNERHDSAGTYFLLATPVSGITAGNPSLSAKENNSLRPLQRAFVLSELCKAKNKLKNSSYIFPKHPMFVKDDVLYRLCEVCGNLKVKRL